MERGHVSPRKRDYMIFNWMTTVGGKCNINTWSKVQGVDNIIKSECWTFQNLVANNCIVDLKSTKISVSNLFRQ